MKYYLVVFSDFDKTHYSVFSSKDEADIHASHFKKSKVLPVTFDVVFYSVIYDYFTKEFDVQRMASAPETYYKGPKHFKDFCQIYIKHEVGKGDYSQQLENAKKSILDFISNQRGIFDVF